MLKELTQLSLGAWVLILVAGVVVLRIVARYWWRLRKAEMEFALRRELLEHGYPVADIERLLPGENRRRKARDVPPSSPCRAESAPPLPSQTFSEWYTQRFSGIPVVIQIFLWLLYGYLWIPLWYAATWVRPSPADAAGNPSGRILAVCGGIALVFGGLFGGIALLVYTVQSSTDVSRRLKEGDKIMPESRVVAVQMGGAGSCRITIGREYFWAYDDIDVSAVVIAQSDPTSQLRVQANPARIKLGALGPSSVAVELQSLHGTGDFTVQVTVVDKFQRCAETTFTVQVRPAAAAVGPGPEKELPVLVACQTVLAGASAAGAPVGCPGGTFALAMSGKLFLKKTSRFACTPEKRVLGLQCSAADASQLAEHPRER